MSARLPCLLQKQLAEQPRLFSTTPEAVVLGQLVPNASLACHVLRHLKLHASQQAHTQLPALAKLRL